jgi:general secretion pathway protein A
VSLRYHIHPLKKEETKEYIEQRLKKAGAVRLNYFSSKAIREIHRYSKGIPRLINVLCDNALLLGYAIDQKLVGKSMIREVIGDLEGFSFKGKREFLSPAILTVFAMLGIGLMLFLWEDSFFNGTKAQLYETLKQSKEFAETLFGEIVDKFLKFFG